MKVMKTVAITGGIGSGKSVVSQLLRIEGYPVYDCDSQAKTIMDCNVEMQRMLQNAFGGGVVIDGVVQRRLLADIVFRNAENLQSLNAIVHPAVRRHFEAWRAMQSGNCVFVETAILKESGMEAMVDAVWIVDAPEEERIKRVMARNGLPAEAVIERINSQKKNCGFLCPSFEIKNFGNNSVIRQIHDLLKIIINE